MKRIPYQQMIQGLDQLLFNFRITNQHTTEQYAEVIDEYLQDCQWSWDDIIEYMSKEKEGPNELAN
jgi:hypothetical protein